MKSSTLTTPSIQLSYSSCTKKWTFRIGQRAICETDAQEKTLQLPIVHVELFRYIVQESCLKLKYLNFNHYR